MINFVHKGMGGQYATYVKQTVQKIARLRDARLSSDASSASGYRVAVCATGAPLTIDDIEAILRHRKVTFFLGDSAGLDPSILSSSDKVVSVSSLPVAHHMEAAIIADQVEKALVRSLFAD